MPVLRPPRASLRRRHLGCHLYFACRVTFLSCTDIYPTPDNNNRVLADYLNGVEIMGGTGAFERATGTIFFFGAGDLSLGQITLRYAGTVCFPTVKAP